MTLRLLHLADLHLDTPVGGRTPEVRGRVRRALHEAFRRAVERALEEEVHAVLVAGDAFDDPLLSGKTADLFRGELLRLARADIHVAWCTGNHDPGGKTVHSRRGRAALLGLDDPARHGHPRLHVFREQRARTVLLTDGRGDELGTLTSIGHRTDQVGDNLAERLSRPAGDLPAVAMLHTQVEAAPGAPEHARYAPCTARDLATAGFDYWALGHVHVQGQVPGAPAWYSGNLQGRNAKETGPRGGLLVEVDAGEPPRVTPVELAPLRFETIALSGLEDVSELPHLARRIDEALGPRGAGAERVVRAVLSGPSPVATQLASPEERASACRDLALELDLVDVELRLDGLTAPRNLADFHATESALREAHRLLVGAEGRDALALELGDVELSPEAPPLGAPDRAAYLRALLAGASDELVARAFRGGDR